MKICKGKACTIILERRGVFMPEDDYVEVYNWGGLCRVWLQDTLDEKKIPYKIEDTSHWRGMKFAKFYIHHALLVEECNEKMVQALIDEYHDEYYNPDNIIYPDYADFRDDIDELPQVECPHCGESHDFDYPKCPFCHK